MNELNNIEVFFFTHIFSKYKVKLVWNPISESTDSPPQNIPLDLSYKIVDCSHTIFRLLSNNKGLFITEPFSKEIPFSSYKKQN